jgi:hypothetical protein
MHFNFWTAIGIILILFSGIRWYAWKQQYEIIRSTFRKEYVEMIAGAALELSDVVILFVLPLVGLAMIFLL